MQKYFRTFIFSNSQIELLVSFSRSTNVNVNMSFLIVILKETLLLMCLASHFKIIERCKLYVGHRDIYYANNIKFFICVVVRILVKKWNMYEAHISPRPLQQTFWLETISLCLITLLRVNKNFKIHNNFIKIMLTFVFYVFST